MRKFIAQLNGGDYVNIPADEMKLQDGEITVYRNGELVAYLDTGVVLVAHISDKPENT